nr:MAG TPA: hypothetical protein [Caudoviricetes sp.]
MLSFHNSELFNALAPVKIVTGSNLPFNTVSSFRDLLQ